MAFATGCSTESLERMTRRRILAIGAVFYVLAIALAWHPVSNALAIDSCLDSGGSFDYAAGVCDLRISHPYQPPSIGEFVLLGGAGALELVISLLVVRTGKVPPTINQTSPDPECDLDCVPNTAVERTVDVALSNSFGFGGHNVTLAVTRFEP